MSPSKVKYSCLQCKVDFNWYPAARDHAENSGHSVYDSLNVTEAEIVKFMEVHRKLSLPEQEQPRHAFD